jgi:uroporphyrinogen-III synthase
MDLKHNQITIGELLADPRARQVLTKRFPHVIGRPIVAASGNMTVERAMKLGSAYVPKAYLQETLAELKRL